MMESVERCLWVCLGMVFSPGGALLLYLLRGHEADWAKVTADLLVASVVFLIALAKLWRHLRKGRAE